MLKKILKIFLVIVVIIALFLLIILSRMGAFKTIVVNTPETCESFPMSGSAEDIEIDYERGLAYLSLQDRVSLIKGEKVQGSIVKIDLKKTPFKITPALTQQPDHLRPHGISLHIDDKGKRHLAVINHPQTRGKEPENIDLFSETRLGVFKYTETVSDPLFKSPNDVLLVAPKKFYVGNDKGGETRWDSIQENLGRPMANIAYFDGNSTTIAAQNLSQVSGINISRDARLVFASETGAKRIAVFKINPENGKLKLAERIKLNGSPDNINVSENGSLVVANIPKILALIQHFVALQKGEIKPSPSQVVRINYQGLGDSKIDELFMSEGDDLSTASVGAIWNGRLFMGSIDDNKMLVCNL